MSERILSGAKVQTHITSRKKGTPASRSSMGQRSIHMILEMANVVKESAAASALPHRRIAMHGHTHAHQGSKKRDQKDIDKIEYDKNAW